ncbi:MAG: peptidase S10, partial [Verrucomicrobiota bacterium]
MKRFLTYALFVLMLGTVSAQDESSNGESNPEKSENKQAEAPKPVSKLNTVKIGDQEFEYEVTAGTIALPKKDRPNESRAQVFFTSYIVEQEEGEPDRPISFCFNGGPGSSSVWLHLGAFGPRRVQLDEEGTGETLAPPPYRLIDNEHSILDVTDLVFIDPVSTGLSRAEESKNAKEFHGFDGDLESVGRFIHQYCSQNGRWDSPKFLMGESYGGLRAGGLSEHLQDRYGMYLNGIVLVSAVLDFRTLLFSDDNDLPFELFLPCYAATAQFHGKNRFKTPASAHKAAEEFVRDHYAPALRLGNKISEEKRKEIIAGVARLTGLDEGEISRANLRPNSSYFRKLLLRDEGKSIGRFDSRVIGVDAEKAWNYPEYDASYAVVYGPFAGAFNHYLR